MERSGFLVTIQATKMVAIPSAAAAREVVTMT
jgi:hypothetical protein